MNGIQIALGRVLEHRDLAAGEMDAAMREIMTGKATPAQIGAFLAALRMKGETVEEVAAAARVMRSLAAPVALGDRPVIDIVGTGGDASHTFNISTCSAVVAAAAGVRVAKHGNRAASSKSGAADLLEAAGVDIDLSPEQVASCIERLGIGFMFAQRHHAAMKHAIGPRREMGARTLFNLLGPLTNPAGATSQVLGVFDKAWVRPLADVLSRLGSHHVLVVHGADGMDEISISGPTHVAELAAGVITEYRIAPGDFGLDEAPLAAIQVGNPAESLAMVDSVLANEPGPARDIVSLNAGAAIYVGGGAATLGDGVERAKVAIASGAARGKLDELVAFTGTLTDGGTVQ